jgi:acyl-CoA thioesterase I
VTARRILILFVFALVALLASRPLSAATDKTIVCFGDSITAGLGLDADKSFPSALERLLIEKGYHYRVINQGISGNTTKDAVARVHTIIALHPDVVLVEFGGNDGLRGISAELTRRNLDSVVASLRDAHIQVLLVGITLPPNFGADYIKSFDATFRAVADKYHVPLKPMLYDGIYQLPGTIQPDGIHPTAKGSQLIAEHLLPLLVPMLHK